MEENQSLQFSLVLEVPIKV